MACEKTTLNGNTCGEKTSQSEVKTKTESVLKRKTNSFKMFSILISLKLCPGSQYLLRRQTIIRSR